MISEHIQAIVCPIFKAAKENDDKISIKTNFLIKKKKIREKKTKMLNKLQNV